MNEKVLSRPANDKVVAGVCSGLARYFGLNVSTVRLVTLILILCAGLSLWAYIILWILMPTR